MSHIVYIVLGTNLGDRLANLKAALAALPPDVQVIAESQIYETPPWGYVDQPAFLNQVIQVETDLSPHDLLAYLKRLEREMGRKKTIRYGPRSIDLDILFYDDLILDTPGLTIPHARMNGRAFVLVPLADLAPHFYHPVEEKSIQELLRQVNTNGIAVYSAEN